MRKHQMLVECAQYTLFTFLHDAYALDVVLDQFIFRSYNKDASGGRTSAVKINKKRLSKKKRRFFKLCIDVSNQSQSESLLESREQPDVSPLPHFSTPSALSQL